ncbi:MAG: hypothetical protein KBD48_02535 [Candidatus Pacebacteria bacterium]|nr:hypothetical protein [Candidatus Paceibacterota bacterium]MBP9716041.1 hypothetical protein [Candidatus Paceibacterota bacterium]
MSAPHGHGAPGHSIPKAPPMEPTTDSKTIERRALIHKLDDADAGARGRILSGTLSPEADATARKTILENREKRADILDEEKKANEFVKNLIEKKKSLKTKIDNLHKNINEYKYRDGFKDALQHELDLAHNDLREVQENIENNAKNVQDHKLKENLDNTRKEYLAEYEKHAKNLKNKVAIKNVKTRLSNIYQSTANIFRKEDNKKNLKGYKSVETYGDKNLREKRALYDDARVLLAQNMYERKEEELNASGIEASEQIKKLKYYKATEIIQKVYVEEKAKTREAISSLERTKLDRLGLWYSKQPRWKKVALGTALFVGGGSAFAASMIAKYGIGWCIAGKFATSYGVGYITNTATGKVIDRIHKKGDKDFRNSIDNDKLDLSSNFTRGDTDMTLLEYERQLSIIERRENEKLQKRMSAKMWAGLGLGIGAGALTYNLMADCTSPTTREIPMTKGDHFKAPAPVQLEKTLDEFVVKADRIETVPKPPAPISTGGDPVMLKYPDLNIDQTEFKNMEGGLATTSDFTPHTTADEFNPGNSNADQTPAVEKPKYNFGDYNPDERNLDQENPESGERLDLPETPGDATEPKIGGGTSAENTNTESGLNNTAGKGLKMDYHETQKIQENQFQKIKSQIGNEEYEKLIKTLDNNMALYKTDINELRTIAVGENRDESFSRELALNNAREQLREQAGLKDAVFNDRGPSRVITSQLPNGEFRTIVVQAAHHVNNIEVDDLFNTENIPVTAEENVKAIINQSNQNAERFMALSGTDEGTMKSILTPKDSNHIRIVSERTSPDLAKAREMIVNDRMALNKVMGDDSVSMVGNSMDRIFKDSNGDYHVYRIYEIKDTTNISGQEGAVSGSGGESSEINYQNEEYKVSNIESGPTGIESETNLAIENIIKEGKYKDIVKNVEMLGYTFEGSRSADVTVLKFLESYKSGEYTLAIDSADAPTHDLASQAISQRQGFVNTAEKMNLWKKTDSGYHMISIRLIKK